MTKTDYTEFDKELIAAIRSGITRFEQISNSHVRGMADQLAKPALRMKGVLTFSRKDGWRVKGEKRA